MFFLFLTTFINTTFSSCIDGDTAKLIVDSKVESVRFLAVDTPELGEYYYEESSVYTCNELKSAENVKLELDENSDKRDKYNRLLAWVFVDDLLLQDKIIKNGYGKVAYLYDDYKYTDLLLVSEELAQINAAGMYEKVTYNYYLILLSVPLIAVINYLYYKDKRVKSYISKTKSNKLLQILYVLTVLLVLIDFLKILRWENINEGKFKKIYQRK